MIKIICVGKIKENYMKDLINDYSNRLRKYTKLEIIEVKDDFVYEKEIKNLLNVINENDFNVGLDIKGEMLDSKKLASFISETLIFNSNITFIIGGSNGLNDAVKNKCNKLISFSELTFPHGLFRGILLEQIYRAYKIINNESYHK